MRPAVCVQSIWQAGACGLPPGFLVPPALTDETISCALSPSCLGCTCCIYFALMPCWTMLMPCWNCGQVFLPAPGGAARVALQHGILGGSAHNASTHGAPTQGMPSHPYIACCVPYMYVHPVCAYLRVPCVCSCVCSARDLRGYMCECACASARPLCMCADVRM